MVVEAAVAVFMATVVVIAVVATAAVISAAATMAMGISDSVILDTPLLAALALTPCQAITMAFMQMGCLATIAEFMLKVNLTMITAAM